MPASSEQFRHNLRESRSETFIVCAISQSRARAVVDRSGQKTLRKALGARSSAHQSTSIGRGQQTRRGEVTPARRESTLGETGSGIAPHAERATADKRSVHEAHSDSEDVRLRRSSLELVAARREVAGPAGSNPIAGAAAKRGCKGSSRRGSRPDCDQRCLGIYMRPASRDGTCPGL
ncbi:hypothetical protein BKA93DRAFT_534980 [Sparassis latifolia]